MGQKKSRTKYCDCLFLRWYYDELHLKVPEENIKFDIFKPLDLWIVDKKNNVPVDSHIDWPVTKSLVINLFDPDVGMNDLNCILKYLAECSLDYLYIRTARVDQMLFMLQNMGFVRIHTLILELDQQFFSPIIAGDQKNLYESKILELKDTMDMLCHYRKIEALTLFYVDTNNTSKFFWLRPSNT